MPRPKNPNKRNVTLLVDGELYDKYRKQCKNEGILVSRQFEKLMEKELKVSRNG
jgi:phage/plasmid-associated DNA primase